MEKRFKKEILQPKKKRNNGAKKKEPLKKYHSIDGADCFQYYNPTILKYIESRI